MWNFCFLALLSTIFLLVILPLFKFCFHSFGHFYSYCECFYCTLVSPFCFWFLINLHSWNDFSSFSFSLFCFLNLVDSHFISSSFIYLLSVLSFWPMIFYITFCLMIIHFGMLCFSQLHGFYYRGLFSKMERFDSHLLISPYSSFIWMLLVIFYSLKLYCNPAAI